MMDEDENSEDTSSKDSPEEPSDEPDTEPKETGEGGEEQITATQAYELARSLQKGYTLTRQDMAEIRTNQAQIQEALEKIQKSSDTGFGAEDEEPLTVSKFLVLQQKQQQQAKEEDRKINQRIETQLTELRAQGIIKDNKEEEEILNFAVKKKITDLSQAAERWSEIQTAKKEGLKEGAKGKVRQEAGSKIGTSQKTKTDREKGFDYDEIATKNIEDFAEE